MRSGPKLPRSPLFHSRYDKIESLRFLIVQIGALIKAGGLFHKRPGSRMRVIDSIPGLNVKVQMSDLLRIFKLML